MKLSVSDKSNIWHRLSTETCRSIVVTLDGTDVTKDCVEADTDEGYVVLLLRLTPREEIQKFGDVRIEGLSE